MTSSREKAVSKVISIILLTTVIYFLSQISFGKNSQAVFYRELSATLVLSFNIVILFSWIGFGITGGTIISIIIALTTLVFDARMGLCGYSVCILPFFITALAGYRFARNRSELDNSSSLMLEKIDEDRNLRDNATEKKKASLSALKEKLMRYSLLKEASEAFSTVLVLDDVNKLIIEKVSGILGKPGRILLYLVDAQRQELMLSASMDASRVKEKRGDIFDHWVLRNRKSLIVEDVPNDFRFPSSEVEESKKIFRSLIVTPFTSEDKVIGILRMDAADAFAYGQDDLRLLDIIADLAAVSIQNAMLYSRTQELAIKDSLTGLSIRRYFLERFDEEIKKAAGRKGRLALLMFDIDHFKEYNDMFGHMAGDLVLKHLADIISSMAREGDIVARFGGEEIAVMLLGRSKDEASIEAERIRKAIKDSPLVLRRRATEVTVSIGISGYPQDALLKEELIRIADERLYKAKVGGRNRVCVC